jgi:hypothetical protein
MIGDIHIGLTNVACLMPLDSYVTHRLSAKHSLPTHALSIHSNMGPIYKCCFYSTITTITCYLLAALPRRLTRTNLPRVSVDRTTCANGRYFGRMCAMIMYSSCLTTNMCDAYLYGVHTAVIRCLWPARAGRVIDLCLPCAQLPSQPLIVCTHTGTFKATITIYHQVTTHGIASEMLISPPARARTPGYVSQGGAPLDDYIHLLQFMLLPAYGSQAPNFTIGHHKWPVVLMMIFESNIGHLQIWLYVAECMCVCVFLCAPATDGRRRHRCA